MKLQNRALVAMMIGMCLTACGGNGTEIPAGTVSPTTTEAVEIQVQPIRVCVLYDGTSDQISYNEFFREGVQKATTEYNWEIFEAKADDETSRKECVRAACEEGYPWIISASPVFAEYIAEYAQQYPEQQFAIMDVDVDLPNVQSVYITYEESFFEAGALAATVAGEFTDEDEEKAAVIGWVGGMNLPVIQEFYQAYAEGAMSVDPEIQILEAYVGSWYEPNLAEEQMQSQYAQGAAFVMNIASAEMFEDAGAMIAGGCSRMKTETKVATGSDAAEEIQTQTVLKIVEYPEALGYVITKAMAEGKHSGGTTRLFSQKDGVVGVLRDEIKMNVTDSQGGIGTK